MKILYATDGSEGALAAGHFLAALPLGKDVSIHIVTAVEEVPREQGSLALRQAREALGAFPGTVTTAMVQADSTSATVEALLWAADYQDADMIAVGARGRSAVARFFLGSVAEGLLRHADIPVLLARPGGLPLRTVVMGVDGSPYARSAASWAASCLPLPTDCALHLMQAVVPPVWAAYSESMLVGSYDQTVEQMVESDRTAVHKVLEEFAHELGGQGRQINVDAPIGSPEAELLRAVKNNNAGLAVVGSRGLKGLPHYLLGSVSTAVVHHAPCSVLVVPPSSPIQTASGNQPA